MKPYDDGYTQREWKNIAKYLDKKVKAIGKKDMYYIVMKFGKKQDSKYWQQIKWEE